MTATLDPVTLAVLKGRLEQIANEMDATLYRSAFNPIIADPFRDRMFDFDQLNAVIGTPAMIAAGKAYEGSL